MHSEFAALRFVWVSDCTDAVHPADVGRGTSEDGGLLVSVAAGGRHKAGHTMDNPLAIDTTVQGAARVTLRGFRENTSQNSSESYIYKCPISKCS